MIAADDLRGAITAAEVIERYGLQAKRRGTQFRLSMCPRCGEKSAREAIAIDAKTGQWLHHGFERASGGSCSGDILDLIAACEGLDCGRNFRKVAEIAAQIAGITDESEVERDRRRQASQERARAEAAADLQRQTSARVTASEAWDVLARRDSRGEDYLSTRGLDPIELVDLDAVRFSRHGLVVAIRDVDGCPISTATRLYEPGDRPKVLALKDHSTRGTMIDATRDIVHGRDVIIAEGVIDSLTARLAWPSATVLGSNGAGGLSRIAEMAIIRVKLARTRLVLLPHADEQGISACTTAGRIAIAAGLDLGRDLLVTHLPAPDLNAAWCDGWRPNAEERWSP